MQYPVAGDGQPSSNSISLPATLDASASIKDLTAQGVFQPITSAQYVSSEIQGSQPGAPSGFAANRYDGTFQGWQRQSPANQSEWSFANGGDRMPAMSQNLVAQRSQWMAANGSKDQTLNKSDLFPFIKTQPPGPYDNSMGGRALDAGMNYYRFNGADRAAINTSANDINGIESREQLAPGETPTIKIVYQDTKNTSGEQSTVPDFRIAADGTVQIINDPETNPLKEIVIEVARGTGYIGLPNDAQQKALSTLTEYLSARIRNEFNQDPSSQVNLEDQQGLLPADTASQINAAPQPEDSLPAPAQSQTEALNRMDGSDSGSMSPAQASDYFPPSDVPPLPDETPNLTALKDLVAGFATHGLPNPYTAVQDRGDNGFGVGRYALTGNNIFDWISGLSDDEISNIQEMEITTPDGKKIKIKIPKDTGTKLKKVRDLLHTVKAGHGQKKNLGNPTDAADATSDPTADSSDANNAIKQLFNDPDVSDLTNLLVKMQNGQQKPTADEINKSLGPDLQEVIATDLIYKYAKDSTDPQTNKVNIGEIVLSMELGHTPSAAEMKAPQNLSLMSAAEKGYPLALQHAQQPDQPVTWNESNGKIIGDPNSYFFSQFKTDTYNPTGPGRSNNCGPASLAMAAKAFGKDGQVQNAEQQIDRAREAMTGRNDYSELTSLSEIANGAKKLGLQTENVSDLNSLNQAIDTGKQVVLFGNPAGAYGDRLSNSQYAHYNGMHFVLVAGKAAEEVGKAASYVVNDPLSRKGSITVSSNELQRYMRKENSGRTGIAVWA